MFALYIFEKGFPSSGITSFTTMPYSLIKKSQRAIYLVLLFCLTFSKIVFAKFSKLGKKFLFSCRKSEITSPGKAAFLLSIIFPDIFQVYLQFHDLFV